MKTSSLEEALICAFTALHEVLPAQCRQSVDTILRTAIADGLIKDPVSVRVLGYLVEEPEPARLEGRSLNAFEPPRLRQRRKRAPTRVGNARNRICHVASNAHAR